MPADCHVREGVRADVGPNGIAIAVEQDMNARWTRDQASHSHGNALICCSGAESTGLGWAWGSESGAGVGVEVVVEPVVDGSISFVATEGFCSSWQRCAISLLILVSERWSTSQRQPPEDRKNVGADHLWQGLPSSQVIWLLLQ